MKKQITEREADMETAKIHYATMGTTREGMGIISKKDCAPRKTLNLTRMKVDFFGRNPLKSWLRVLWLLAKSALIMLAFQCMAIGFLAMVFMLFLREQTFTLLTSITHAEAMYVMRGISIDFWMPVGGMFCAALTVMLVLNKYVEPKEAI